jgi:hypothetical protein
MFGFDAADLISSVFCRKVSLCMWLWSLSLKSETKKGSVLSLMKKGSFLSLQSVLKKCCFLVLKSMTKEGSFLKMAS